MAERQSQQAAESGERKLMLRNPIVEKAFQRSKESDFMDEFDRKYEELYLSGALTIIEMWEPSVSKEDLLRHLATAISTSMQLGYMLRVAEEEDKKNKN